MQNAKLTYADQIRLEARQEAWDEAWNQSRLEFLTQQILDVKDDFTMEQLQKITKLSIDEIQAILDGNNLN